MSTKPGVLVVMDRAAEQVVIRCGLFGGSEYQAECATEALRAQLAEARATVERLAKAAEEHLRRPSASSEESLLSALAAYKGE